VERFDSAAGEGVISVRNRLPVGEVVEVLQPRGPLLVQTISRMTREDSGEELSEAHANYTVRVPMAEVKPLSMLRVKRS